MSDPVRRSFVATIQRGLFVCVVAASLCTRVRAADDARAANACVGEPRVVLGGVTGFAAFADPQATRRLRASCDVGLYIHAEGWRPLDPQTRSRILAAFRGTGSPVVELGYVDSPGGYFKNFYRPTFADAGVAAKAALVNGLCHDGIAGALAYIAVARSYGLATVGVVFAPNGGQSATSRFGDARWDCVRSAALAGGALAIDAPPHVFFASPSTYRAFVLDEIRWAHAHGIASYAIVSPNASGTGFARETDELFAAFATGGVAPTRYVFETYDVRRTDVANTVGSETSPGTVAAVTLHELPTIATR